MSIQTQIDRISGNVSAALSAIVEKGVTVPDGSTSDALAELITSIEAGGGNQLVYGTYTPASNQTVEYGGSFSAEFGFVPDVFVMHQQEYPPAEVTKNSASIIIFRPYAYGSNIKQNFFYSFVSAPTSTSQTATSKHRYYGTPNIMTETKVKFFGPSGSLLVAGVEYFWIAAKLT